MKEFISYEVTPFFDTSNQLVDFINRNRLTLVSIDVKEDLKGIQKKQGVCRRYHEGKESNLRSNAIPNFVKYKEGKKYILLSHYCCGRHKDAAGKAVDPTKLCVLKEHFYIFSEEKLDKKSKASITTVNKVNLEFITPILQL